MPERQRDFLSELFQTVADRSRKLLGLAGTGSDALPAEALAEALLSTRGEASGVALARALLDRWKAMDSAAQLAFFRMLARDLGPSRQALDEAIAAWSADPTPENASALHEAAEPRRQELLRRINMAPGGTAALVAMRERLMAAIADHPELAPVDADFAHLFASWFNPGFLMLRRIGWSSPADVLEKIIRYEAVHEIRNWNDLRGRVQPADRRCFAFFHPQMPDEPLVFVEVALTRGTPAAITGLIAEDRKAIGGEDADTAVFYSISNTQKGLRGVSFGNFLIKQVVDELSRELPQLKTFVTLSPVPGFAAWLADQHEDRGGGRIPAELLDLIADPDWAANAERMTAAAPWLEQAAAIYLLDAKGSNGKPADPVARFHLNNGAMLSRINPGGDLSAKGLSQSHGVMVNYLYDLEAITRHHEAYANTGEEATSASVKKLLTGPAGKPRSLSPLLPQRIGGS